MTIQNLLLLILGGVLVFFPACHPKALGRHLIDLSGSGWHLWQDKAAAWENDELFLPPVDLFKVAVNEATGAYFGLYAPARGGESSTKAFFDWFDYRVSA
jgi:hypothetical protein